MTQLFIVYELKQMLSHCFFHHRTAESEFCHPTQVLNHLFPSSPDFASLTGGFPKRNVSYSQLAPTGAKDLFCTLSNK